MGRSSHHTRGRGREIFAREAAFRGEFLDFERGIRIGHIEPAERLTQIIKHRLTARHDVRMVCDRWGRGVYWQWICWVPEPNKKAKPISSGYNFSSAKFFAAIDRESRTFQTGVQVERAPEKPTGEVAAVRLEEDWDWHVFLRALRGTKLPRALGGLVREGFHVRAGPFPELTEYHRRNWDVARLRKLCRSFAPSDWGGFQLFWPMSEKEVRATSGPDIVDAMMAVFEELTPVVSLWMYAPCLREK